MPGKSGKPATGYIQPTYRISIFEMIEKIKNKKGEKGENKTKCNFIFPFFFYRLEAFTGEGGLRFLISISLEYYPL